MEDEEEFGDFEDAEVKVEVPREDGGVSTLPFRPRDYNEDYFAKLFNVNMEDVTNDEIVDEQELKDLSLRDVSREISDPKIRSKWRDKYIKIMEKQPETTDNQYTKQLVEQCLTDRSHDSTQRHRWRFAEVW